MSLNIFSLILLLSGLLVAGISVAILNKLDKTVRWFAITMLLVSLWAIAYGLELASLHLEDMLFWIKIEYIGISFAPAAWLWFCLKYSGLEKWINKRGLFAVFLFPTITYLMVLTNSWHQLHYKDWGLADKGPFPLLEIVPGPWYFIHTAYFYFSLLLGNLFLFRKFRNADPFYRKQALLLIAAGIFPWLVNLVYLMGFRPFEHIDLTPYAFLILYLIIGYGLLRLELFKIKPIAREKFIAAIPQGILVVDPLFQVIDTNPAFLNILTLKNNRIIGKDVRILLKDFPDIIEKITEKQSGSIEQQIVKPERSYYYLVKFIPLTDKKQIFTGMMIVFDDLTYERETNLKIQQQAEELLNLNKLKDKLFVIISHDLKGPIYGLREVLRLTQEGLISKDEFFDILPEISKNLDSVSILMENLLAWTSSQLKGEMIDKKTFDLSLILDQQYTLFKKLASEKGIRLSVEKEGNLSVFADQNMVDLILRNLIANAIKFSGKGDQVKIIATEKTKDILIEVMDTGMGIPPENLEKLTRGESFTTLGKQKELGTGLGILLVRDYINKNGDTLKISSQLNKGSHFSFSLPKA